MCYNPSINSETEHGESKLPCPYAAAGFCVELPNEIRGSLCEICHIKRYARGQCLRENYWAGSISMVLEGLCVQMETQVSLQRARPVELGTVGTFFNLKELYGVAEEYDIDNYHDTLCFTTCTIGVFAVSEFHQLMNDCTSFREALFRHLVRVQMPEKTAFVSHVGFGDAEESIRFIVKMLMDKGIGYLTHEQIALLTGRSRQTVTTVMKHLQNAEPDLFTKVGELQQD